MPFYQSQMTSLDWPWLSLTENNTQFKNYTIKIKHQIA